MVVVFFLSVSPSFDHDADVKENVLENAGEAFRNVIVRSDTQSSGTFSSPAEAASGIISDGCKAFTTTSRINDHQRFQRWVWKKERWV
jgi:hypothetical protein